MSKQFADEKDHIDEAILASELDDAWTTAREAAVDEHINDIKSEAEHSSYDFDIHSSAMGFRDGLDFGRSYGRTEILSSPEMRGLVEAMEKSIPEFQWVTNGIKMNEAQHIRLGDAICDLHDTLAAFKARFPGGGE